MDERRRGHGVLFRKTAADTSLAVRRQVKHFTQGVMGDRLNLARVSTC